MSDQTHKFSVRLSPADYARLEQVAARFALDRTGAVRLLIRRAAVTFSAEGHFSTLERGRAGRVFALRLRKRSNDDQR